MFSIDEFTSILGKGGFSHESLFAVMVSPPAGLGLGSSGTLANLRFRAESVDFPTRSMATSELRYYGPIQKIAHSPMYNDVNVSFILSEDFSERLLFETWQDKMTGDHRLKPNEKQLDSTFNIGYYDDYVGTVEIFQYDTTGNVKFECKLLEAYPMALSGQNGNWNSIDRTP